MFLSSVGLQHRVADLEVGVDQTGETAAGGSRQGDTRLARHSQRRSGSTGTGGPSVLSFTSIAPKHG